MIHAGTVGPVTFLFTDAQIKREDFLELINATLLTGDVPGFWRRDDERNCRSLCIVFKNLS